MSLKTHVMMGLALSLGLSLNLKLTAQTTVASDNAGNYSSWNSGSTGGTGFGAWSFNDTTPNGGFSGQFLSTGNATSIDTAGNAFGMYANGGASAQSQAKRTFLNGAMFANETFSIQMQNGNVTDNGGQVGFSLQDSTSANLFQFYFAGGGSDYLINVNGNQISTGVGFTSGALTLDFSQGAGNAWFFSIYVNGSLQASLDSIGTGQSLAANDISQINLFSQNGGSSRTLGDNANLYFNNMIETQPTPEPSTLALAGISGLATLIVIRRRR